MCERSLIRTGDDVLEHEAAEDEEEDEEEEGLGGSLPAVVPRASNDGAAADVHGEEEASGTRRCRPPSGEATTECGRA